MNTEGSGTPEVPLLLIPRAGFWQLWHAEVSLRRLSAAGAAPGAASERHSRDYSYLKFNYILKQQLNCSTSTKCFAWLQTARQRINP